MKIKKVLTKSMVLAIVMLLSLFFIAPATAYADGSKIAFVSTRDGNWEIYIMNVDGTGQTNLTNNSAYDYYPSFSPDGSKIAFSSDLDGGNDAEIYIMNVDGTGQTRLTNNSSNEYYPSFSPDGSKIAFMSYRDQYWKIYIMNVDGTEETNLTNNLADESNPSFSPDGSKIAFSSNRDGNWEIYIMNVDGTGQTNLTNNSAYEYFPSFSPDGSKIAFSYWSDENPEIYLMNVDGSEQTNLTNNSVWDDYPSFSPDGTEIAFNSNRDGNWEIYIMNVDGSGQTNLTNNSVDDDYPSFSPVAPATATPATDGGASLNLSIAQQADLYGKTTTGFAKTLYDNILGRVADGEGLNNWVTALNDGIITPKDVVYNIVFSNELKPIISSMGPKEFITFLYKNVFNREPDPQGFAGWVNIMKNGMSKEEVLLHFTDCDEFKNICEMFGLGKGINDI